MRRRLATAICVALLGSAGLADAESATPGASEPAPEPIATSVAAATTPLPADTILAGFPVGGTVAELRTAVGELHVREMPFGEIHYRVCDRGNSVVYSFTEQAWARGRISDIWIRGDEDESGCEADGVAFPDAKLPTTTAQGIDLGASAAAVIEAYGAPSADRSSPLGTRVLTYTSILSSGGASKKEITFTLAADTVVGILLTIDLDPAGS